MNLHNNETYLLLRHSDVAYVYCMLLKLTQRYAVCGDKFNSTKTVQ